MLCTTRLARRALFYGALVGALAACNNAQNAQQLVEQPANVGSPNGGNGEPANPLEGSGEWLVVPKQENADSGVVIRLKAALDRPDRDAQVEWIQKSGPAVTIINPNLLTAEVILPSADDVTPLVFEITAISQGQTLRAEQTIVVMPLSDEALRATVINTVLQPGDDAVTLTLNTPTQANTALNIAVTGGSAVAGTDFELGASPVMTADGTTVNIPITLLPGNQSQDVYTKLSIALPNGEAATVIVVIPESTSQAVTQAAVNSVAAPSLTEVAEQVFKEGTAITPIILANSGGELTDCPQDQSNLPVGLTVKAESNTCVISGTPTEAQPSATYSVTAINTDGSDSQEIIITVEAFSPFITTWKTDNPGVTDDNQLQILTAPDVEYNFDIDWGDGKTDKNITSSITHDYENPGTYTVKIKGLYPRHFSYDYDAFEESDEDPEFSGDAEKLVSIDAWGDIEWQSMMVAFARAKNMTLNTTENDVPNLSQVTDLTGMFVDAESFNSDISNWDFSGIESMQGMFVGTVAFDQDLSKWVVDSARITNMSFMFYGAESFNSDLSSWDLSNVETLEGIFGYTKAFNQDLSGWTVTSALKNTKEMFAGAESFNGNLSNWDMSSVTDMSMMFLRTSVFNQDISGWNVSSVKNMERMFSAAAVFNQNIGEWDISSVEDMTYMLADTTFSTKNYDAILQGWNTKTSLMNVQLGSINSTYSNDAINARNVLTEQFNWVLDDKGLLSGPNGELTGNWTRWFNQSVPDDDGEAELLDASIGDGESVFLGGLRGEPCFGGAPVDIRGRVVGSTELFSSALDAPNKLAIFSSVSDPSNQFIGLLCVNDDQEEGVKCEDYEVSFLCSNPLAS